jgi:hypothetical protein
MLTFILTRKWLSIKFTEQEFWIKYLCLGVLLGLAYLSLHFLLKTLLFGNPQVAKKCIGIIAAAVAYVLTLLGGFLSLIVVSAMITTGEETFAYLIDLSIIALFIGCPALCLWWYAAKAFLGKPNNSFNRSAN